MNIKNYLGYTTDDNKFSSAILFLRLLIGGLMLTHGVAKMMSFGMLSEVFPDLLGIGSVWNLVLVIFAEVFCSIALIFGFLVRLSTIPLIVTMVIAVFVAHGNDPINVKELAMVYLGIYIFLISVGAGKYSLDWLIFKKNRFTPECANMASWDRILRIVIGFVFFILYFSGIVSGFFGYLLLFLGFVLIGVSIWGVCPPYFILNINTNKRKDRN